MVQLFKTFLSWFKPKQRKYKISFAAIFSDTVELYDVYTIEATSEKKATEQIKKKFANCETFTINRITEI